MASERGAFRPDDLKLIAFECAPSAPRHLSVVYAYELDGRVVYFGQTGGCAVLRNRQVATDMARKIAEGRPLVGAAWQLYDAIERGRVVSVWTGSPLPGATQVERQKQERVFMQCYGTIHEPGLREHPHRWNDYRLR